MTYQELFEQYKTTLETTMSVAEADAVFFRVLEHLTGKTKTQFYLGNQEVISDEIVNQATEILQRLRKDEPVQYILGEAWFMDKRFYVDPEVLIPRSETEEIIPLIINSVSNPAHVIDLGTGSGCIAITLAKMLNARIYALEISKKALQIARKNAKRHRAGITFIHDDLLRLRNPVEQPFDVIVSNPPYVRQHEKIDMNKNVLNYEPEQALFVPDTDPLRFYRAIEQFASKYLNVGGLLVIEINENLSEQTADIFRPVFQKVEIHKDINNKDRFITASYE